MKYSVSELKGMARKNRQKFHKEFYKGLKESGELEEHLNSAAKDIYEAMKDYEEKLMKQGYTKQQAEDTAWEVLRQEWVLMPPLPDEEEMEPSQDTLLMMWEEKQERQRRLSETID